MQKFIILVFLILALCSFTFAQSTLAELDKIKEIKLLESNIPTGEEKFEDCSQTDFKFTVQTIAFNPDNDFLVYRYIVSGGKIIGEGANVKWDLSGEKPGVYKITAGVDDGCGVCGNTVTKTVVVKDCPNCSVK